jgi:hypothetical protein
VELADKIMLGARHNARVVPEEETAQPRDARHELMYGVMCSVRPLSVGRALLGLWTAADLRIGVAITHCIRS